MFFQGDVFLKVMYIPNSWSLWCVHPSLGITVICCDHGEIRSNGSQWPKSRSSAACQLVAELWIRLCRLAHILDIDTDPQKPMVQSHQAGHNAAHIESRLKMDCSIFCSLFIDFAGGCTHASLVSILSITFIRLWFYNHVDRLWLIANFTSEHIIKIMNNRIYIYIYNWHYLSIVDADSHSTATTLPVESWCACSTSGLSRYPEECRAMLSRGYQSIEAQEDHRWQLQ